MKKGNIRLGAISIVLLVTACGGGGAPGGPPPGGAPPGGPPTINQSPGGIWGGLTDSGENATFWVAEDGRLWSVTPVSVTTGPTFGAGALDVTNGDAVSGAYEAKGVLPDPVSPFPGVLTCQMAGTVTERSVMSVDLGCADASGPVWEESATLFYQTDYDRDSSLSTIAGNYTLGFAALAATNTLNIAGDGTVFGMYDNGPSCTVNGQVSLIDPAYNLYDIQWTFSSCVSPFPSFEGSQFSGIATMTSLGPPAGSFYLLMTGNVGGDFRSISVIYEPT